MHNIKLLFFFVLFVITHTNASSIKVLSEQSKEDAGHSYFIDLLKFTIDKGKTKYEYNNVEIISSRNTTQERTLNLLEKGFVDVFWTGTDTDREQRFTPIRVPLFFGLLGYRISIIHKNNFQKLNQVTFNPDKLKSLTACQGQHWPDSKILEDNGYKVSKVARFESMFKMLSFRRCDYFPRAIFEGYAELDIALKEYPNLMIFDQLILHYPFPIYFFVNKENRTLANQIEFGLKQAINDGSLIEFMKNHPVSKKIFPLKKWQEKQFIHLTNKYLPDETPLNDDSLWIKLH